jgi:putative transcription factor
MADNDWDSVTRIGSKARAGGGGGGDHERVVKGRSAINAAARTGAITGTEKKMSTGNMVRDMSPSLSAAAPLSCVLGANFGCNRNQTPMLNAPPNWTEIRERTASSECRSLTSVWVMRSGPAKKPTLSQDALAKQVNAKANQIADFERGAGPPPDQRLLGALERTLGVRLRGGDIGSPMEYGPKKKK